MVFDLGERNEGWQVIPYLLGFAGTGKSSIAMDVIAKLYSPEDVGILSNNSEKTFGLSAPFWNVQFSLRVFPTHVLVLLFFCVV